MQWKALHILNEDGALMDTTSLYYFTEAAKDLNFTQTANRLFLSQQNLSSHIARLENYCGCKLFLRKPKLSLTYEGEMFLSYAKEAVSMENTVLSELKSVADESSGQLRVGVTTPRAAIFVPDIMQAFREEYPAVSVQLIDQPSYLLEQQLANNTLDLSVGVFFSQNPELQSTHLLTDRLYLCMTDDLLHRCCRVSAEELCRNGAGGISVDLFPDLPVVFPAEGIYLGQTIRSCYEEVSLSPNIILSTTYPQVFRDLYYRGIAAAFATEMILADLMANRPASAQPLRAFPLLLNGALIRREVTLTVNQHRYLSKPAKRFIDLIHVWFSDVEHQRRENRGEVFPISPPPQ